MSSDKWYPKHMVSKFSPDRYDYEWNEDYTEFKPIELKYWDDSSYKDYQGKSCDWDDE